MKITTRVSCEKDIIWRKKVPAQDLIGERQVTLKHGGELRAEVLPPAELLENLDS